MTKVSVLMPVYNASQYLKEAIESILNQSYHDLEIILIDDCSTDDSLELIKRIDDRRIRIVELELNIGIGGALNAGLAVASGKYILRMDADDIALPYRIAQQVEFMERHPEIGVSGALAKSFDGNLFNVPKCQEFLKPSLILDCVFVHPTVIIRKELLDDHNIKFSGYLEDYELWVRLSSLTEFGLLPVVVLFYRRSTGQFTALNHERRMAEANKIRVDFAKKWIGRDLTFSEIQIVSSGTRSYENPRISEVILFCEDLVYANPWRNMKALKYSVKKLFLRNFYLSSVTYRDYYKILSCSFLSIKEKVDLTIKILRKISK